MFKERGNSNSRAAGEDLFAACLIYFFGFWREEVSSLVGAQSVSDTPISGGNPGFRNAFLMRLRRGRLRLSTAPAQTPERVGRATLYAAPHSAFGLRLRFATPAACRSVQRQRRAS